MPLESLHALVETLRQRIERHRSALSGSEWLTRYTIIDPLLRELGWDTEDPELVIPEYSSGGGRADYALLSNGRPAVMVEAKKLGESLSLSVISQVLNYCLIEGTAHFAITDGRRWEIYETHKPVPISEKQVASFDLLDASPSDVCLKALALWHQNIASGKVGTAHTPVVTPTDNVPADAQQDGPPPASSPTQPTATPTASGTVASEDWKLLSRFDPETGSQVPAQIMLPDNSIYGVKYWHEIVGKAVSWLSNNDYLKESDCPIIDGQTCVLSTQPDDISIRGRKEIDSFYFTSNRNCDTLVKRARLIIERVGQDPSQFKVRW